MGFRMMENNNMPKKEKGSRNGGRYGQGGEVKKIWWKKYTKQNKTRQPDGGYKCPGMDGNRRNRYLCGWSCRIAVLSVWT